MRNLQARYLAILVALLASMTGCFLDSDVLLTAPTQEIGDFYRESPSHDIALQIPDGLEIDMGKIYHEEKSFVGYDARRQYAACGITINSKRIFVPDCSVQNIYVFNHQGEYLESEKITREPYYEAGVYVPRWGHRESDGREWLSADETYIYAVIDYDAGHTWVYKNLVKIDIKSKQIVAEIKRVKGNNWFMSGNYIYRWLSNDTGYHAIDKRTLQESPEHNIIIEKQHLGVISDDRFIWFTGEFDQELNKRTKLAYDPVSKQFTNLKFGIDSGLIHGSAGFYANDVIYFRGVNNYKLYGYK